MAVRGIPRNASRLQKRSEYVYNDDYSQSSFDYSSTDDDVEYASNRQTKAKNSKSIKNLLKDCQSYQKSEEHGYTQVAQRPCLGKRNRLISENEVATTRRSTKKSRCESRNAINARINREKKKAYIASLEAEIQELREENKKDMERMAAQTASLTSLKLEVNHLRGLLSNSKYIGALVSKLSEVTGLPVTSSLARSTSQDRNARTRSVPSGFNHPIAKNDVVLGSALELCPEVPDNTDSLFQSFDTDFNFDPTEFLPCDYSDPETDGSFGICVHINQSRLSVEYCGVCNERAMTA